MTRLPTDRLSNPLQLPNPLAWQQMLLLVLQVQFPLTRLLTKVTTLGTPLTMCGPSAVPLMRRVVALLQKVVTNPLVILPVETFNLPVVWTTPLLMLAKPEMKPMLQLWHLKQWWIALKVIASWVPLTRTQPQMAGL